MSYFVSFIILIGVLIFVHELGHFLSGKLLGVKVLTFSLGFPPRLIGRRVGETEYVIGAIPLGGYVKFLGEDAGEDVPATDMARAFHVQPIWKRLVIVLAGPLMNLVFPILIYFIVLSLQPKIVPAVVGMLLPGGPAEKAGLLPGDTITEIDGESIKGFEDLREVVGARAEKTVKVAFVRSGKPMEATIAVEKSIEYLPLDLKREVGRIGIYSSYRSPLVQIPDVESGAYGAGLRTGDRILAIDDKPTVRWFDVERHDFQAGAAARIDFLRPEEIKTPVGSVFAYHPRTVTLKVGPGPEPVDPEALGIESTELYIHSVTPGSVADLIGIRPGDRIESLNRKEIRIWDQLEMTLKAYPENFHDIVLIRPDGSRLEARFKLKKTSTLDQLKQETISYVFGAFNQSFYMDEELIPNPNPISRALKGAVTETVSVIKLTFVGIVRIIQGRISSKTLGGPIMIFDIAGKAAKKGASSYLWIMALISINLGIINLAPIPMLDGGLVVLFLFEAITRRTPGPRFRMIYQYIGLALIGLLIVLVFKNDIERYWDSIVGFFKG